MLPKFVRLFLLILPIFAFFFENTLKADNYSTVEGGVIDPELSKKKWSAHYIIGYGPFRFFSSEAEVRRQIVADGYATAEQINERIGEIYTYPDYDSGFTFFNSGTFKFLDFSLSFMPMKDFLKDLRSSRRLADWGRIGHLSAANASDFKVLTWDNEKNNDWSIELYFYRRPSKDLSVYKLFAVTLKLQAGEKHGDINVINQNRISRTLDAIMSKYGNSDYRIVKNIDHSLKKHYFAYERRLKSTPIVSKVYEKKIEHAPKSPILTQLTISYLQKNKDYGNLKVVYLAAGLLSEVIPHLTTSLVEYDDFKQGVLIDF